MSDVIQRDPTPEECARIAEQFQLHRIAEDPEDYVRRLLIPGIYKIMCPKGGTK